MENKPIRRRGRPVSDGEANMHAYSVCLSPETNALALELGKGDRSKGIRAALRFAEKNHPELAII